MLLKQFVKQHPAEKILSTAKVIPVAMLPVAIALAWVAIVIASACAIDNQYEYVSSFLEVMIAVNASCSYICSSDSWKQKQLSWMSNAGAVVSGLGEQQVNVLSGWYVDIDAANERIREIVRPLGIVFAAIGSLMLVIGFTKEMRPYAVLSAFPLIFYFASIFAVNQLWHLLCRKSSYWVKPMGPGGVDPIDEEMDMNSVLGCTGPVSPEEEAGHE